jgi:diguanylate cyclase (GGDEF)-like protein
MLHRRLLAAGVLAFACAAGAAPAPATAPSATLSLRPGETARLVEAIEAEHGNDPVRVIALLGPLEATARSHGGEDLVVFLAAWGYAHAATVNPAVADAAIEELTTLGEEGHDDAALASAWTLRANLLQFSGQMREAYGWVVGAVPLAHRAGGAPLRYWVDMSAGNLATSTGQLVDAVHDYTEAVQDARDDHNRRREAQAWLSVAPLHLVLGQGARALDAARQVHELGEASDDPHIAVAGWMMEAVAAGESGQPQRQARARAAALRAASAPPSSTESKKLLAGGDDWLDSERQALLEVSADSLSVGQWERARTLALRAQSLARAAHEEDDGLEASIDLGLAEIGLGRVAEGRELVDTAFASMRSQQDAEFVNQLHRYASALERAGQAPAALATLREALLLETRLSRRDRASTVVALQRQRQVEQLEHDNQMQRAELSRQSQERVLFLLLAGAMFGGIVVAASLYRRARHANRQLATNNAELEFVSSHDKVTGLPNRRAMEADADVLGADPYCSVTIAVKQFGLIVGSMGHQLGDTLLCQIAARLDAVTQRRDGRLYRLDGVTFGAIFRFAGPREQTERRVREALDALVAVMEGPFEIGNQALVVSVGIGAACSPDDAASGPELARVAELARLQAHNESGNAYVLYDRRIGESQRDKLRLEAKLAKALEQGHFEIHYQAQRDLKRGRIDGFEALLRWRDGDKMVSPAQFIPLAEETGLIVRIGAWVLREACLQARAWTEAGLGQPVVAVNISPRQFRHPDFLASVAATLRETGADPRQIELEITEGSVMDDAEAGIVQLHALREMGMHLAIDDFGTGYASLAYLRRFPLDRLKIDRSFVIPLNQRPEDDTLVRTMIELAHSLGLAVTAEGVETVEQEAALKAWACDTVQGFLHARPVPVDQATALLVADRQSQDLAAAR